MLTVVLLLVTLGSAKWKREDYCDPTSKQHRPFSTAETGQTRAATTAYITRKDLQEFVKQMNNSWDRLDGIDYSTFNDFEFPNEVDIIFRIHMGIKLEEAVLKDALINGVLRNGKLHTIQMITVNQSFVELVPQSAVSIRTFVNDVTNGTSRPGDSYWWVGGDIDDYNLTISRVRRLSAECSESDIYYLLRLDAVSLLSHRESKTPSLQRERKCSRD